MHDCGPIEPWYPSAGRRNVEFDADWIDNLGRAATTARVVPFLLAFELTRASGGRDFEFLSVSLSFRRHDRLAKNERTRAISTMVGGGKEAGVVVLLEILCY